MNKKRAIFCVSRNGLLKAKEINKKFNSDIYCIEKFADNGSLVMKDGLKAEVESVFYEYETLIFIMAVGIVTRVISTCITTKDKDPAVLCIDEQSRFVISLLSGHLGGANEETELIASELDAIPVVTTASDVGGKIAVDTISQKLNAELDSLESAKKVTSLIVDGKNVKLLIPENIKTDDSPVDGMIVVSNKEKIEISQIIPKNIVIGIGCKRGTLKENLLNVLEKAMSKNNLKMKSIKKIGSAWVKSDEAGLIAMCEEFAVQIEFFSKEQILEVEEIAEYKSEFVKSQIGVSAVSEPCAYLISNRKGRFLERKYCEDGITISIYEE